MFSLPETFTLILAPCSYLFAAGVWQHAQVLLIGAMLCPAQRNVTAAWRVIRQRRGRGLWALKPSVSGPTRAILSTTPALVGLFSLVVLFPHQLRSQGFLHLGLFNG